MINTKKNKLCKMNVPLVGHITTQKSWDQIPRKFKTNTKKRLGQR